MALEPSDLTDLRQPTGSAGPAQTGTHADLSRDRGTAQDKGIELERVLASARRPVQSPRMPAAPPRVRLKTSPLLRRLLPSALVARRAAARGRAAWERDPAAREQTLEAMRAILGGTTRAGEVERLARAHLVESKVNEALFWQPWQQPVLDTRSQANLHAALSSGRGVLISSCHTGPIFLTTSAISGAGRTPYTVAAPWFFQEPSADKWGRRIAHWRRQVHRLDHRAVCSVGSFPVLEALLRDGEVIQLYFDMPGSMQTHFLGKPVMLATGSARLANAADALVLPTRTRRSGHRAHVDVEEPLDSRDFADAQELHRALALVHERLIIELPHILEDPRRAGAWEQGATARAWTTMLRSAPARQTPAKTPHDDSRLPGSRGSSANGGRGSDTGSGTGGGDGSSDRGGNGHSRIAA
jgi:lauroyl/myristoyl acyltransferase